MTEHRLDRPAEGARLTPQFVFGIAVMLAGIALLLDRFGLVNAGFVFRLWPLLLVAFGAMHFTRGHKEHRFWGFFWVFTGSWLLLRNLDIIELGFWELFLPILLIGLGGSVVMRSLGESGVIKPDRDKSSHLFAAFGGSKRRFDGQAFEGAYMTAFMGGCDLDLRRATMKAGEERAVIVFAMMGGHVIRVPSDWEIVVKVSPIFGGVEDKRVPPVAPPPLDGPRPRLVIQGTVVMGGLELKD
jgi:predicted membrane protein